MWWCWWLSNKILCILVAQGAAKLQEVQNKLLTRPLVPKFKLKNSCWWGLESSFDLRHFWSPLNQTNAQYLFWKSTTFDLITSRATSQEFHCTFKIFHLYLKHPYFLRTYAVEAWILQNCLRFLNPEHTSLVAID